MDTKVVKSAVVIMPPQELWGPIQDIRRLNDKAYDRWMPHINLLYPFVPDRFFDEASAALSKQLSSIPPFRVTLRVPSFFEFGASCTVFADPDPKPQLTAVYQRCVAAFPHCRDEHGEGFRPHLTLGQWRGVAATKAAIEDMNWKEISWTCNEVCLISRPADGSGAFTVKKRVQFGVSSSPVAAAASSSVPQQQQQQSAKRMSCSKEECQAADLVTEWLRKQRKQNLPKTKGGLVSCIAPFCMATRKLDTAPYFNWLSGCRFVQSSGENLTINQSLTVPSPSVGLDERVAETLVRLLKNQKNPPKTKTGLMNLMTQACTVKAPVDMESVLSILVSENLFTINSSDDCITYLF